MAQRIKELVAFISSFPETHMVGEEQLPRDVLWLPTQVPSLSHTRSHHIRMHEYIHVYTYTHTCTHTGMSKRERSRRWWCE